MSKNNSWWRGGVIYQIYPRSYQDSNGDGIGDLAGITKRLDYVSELGVDGIWLSPFFKSPMKDFGYDVSDYCDVDPMFGDLNDFKLLVKRAHELNLKVMIDQVLSHTSDQHPWFVESRQSRTNSKSEWFVWADAKDDGNPPNNWLSIFGGSAWQWDTRREQYYMHNFLTSQPDLNFHNPEVQKALLDSVRFWLELGVDGYRLDTANFYFHDASLRDNPARGRPLGDDPAVNSVNPYGWQWHKYDKSQPENLVFLQKLRSLLDEYPNTAMVGEIGDDDGLARMAEYTSGGDKLHMAYCFDLLGAQHDASFLHQLLNRFNQVIGSGWPCWALSNHDVVRVATRWGGANPDARLLRMAAAMQLSLRGTPCLYQGDELGLAESVISFEDLQDPYGITMWPEFKGRDGCRTPMPWNEAETYSGFSQVKPWLPVAPEHKGLDAASMLNRSDSLLNFYQHFLRWRRQFPALICGEQTLLPLHENLLSYIREHADEKILCMFNCSDSDVEWTLPSNLKDFVLLEDSGALGVIRDGELLKFEAWSFLFARLPL